MCFGGHSFGGRKHINKSAPESRDNPAKNNYVFCSSFVFFAPKHTIKHILTGGGGRNGGYATFVWQERAHMHVTQKRHMLALICLSQKNVPPILAPPYLKVPDTTVDKFIVDRRRFRYKMGITRKLERRGTGIDRVHTKGVMQQHAS